MTNASRRAMRQAGFSMIEVLVTVVVLAIGLLGIAGLQFMSKRSNFEAVQRTAATLLANDIIERMRSNAGQLDLYAATVPLGSGSGNTALTLATNCESSSCSTAQLAAYDLYQWQQAINGATEQNGSTNSGGLVSPTACIYTTVSASASDRSGQYIVAIAWRGSTELSDPVNPSPSGTVDPYVCGRSTGAVGSGPYDGKTVANSYRRLLVVSTYIEAQ